MALMILIITASCSKNVDKKIENEPIKSGEENMTGIKIGPPAQNEKNESIHNIFNFDNKEKIARITTICYDFQGQAIQNNDSYEMTLPAKSVSGWKPECPPNTARYNLQIEEIEK